MRTVYQNTFERINSGEPIHWIKQEDADVIKKTLSIYRKEITNLNFKGSKKQDKNRYPLVFQNLPHLQSLSLQDCSLSKEELIELFMTIAPRGGGHHLKRST